MEESSLKEGLEQFYEKYNGQLSHNKKDIPLEVKSFFKSHDIIHVLFDCDISVFGEGYVKIWTIYGTTLGFWGHITEYKKSNAYELSKNFTFKHMVSNIVKLLLNILKLIIKAKQMNKPWPWSNFELYLDKPISEIRKEFNIGPLR